MGRKVAAVVFASALVAVVLSAGARSVAQESGSQPARRLRTSDPPAIFPVCRPGVGLTTGQASENVRSTHNLRRYSIGS